MPFVLYSNDEFHDWTRSLKPYWLSWVKPRLVEWASMRKSPTGDTVIRSGFRRRDHSKPLSQIRNLSALRMKTLRHPIDSPQKVIFVRFQAKEDKREAGVEREICATGFLLASIDERLRLIDISCNNNLLFVSETSNRVSTCLEKGLVILRPRE